MGLFGKIFKGIGGAVGGFAAGGPLGAVGGLLGGLGSSRSPAGTRELQAILPTIQRSAEQIGQQAQTALAPVVMEQLKRLRSGEFGVTEEEMMARRGLISNLQNQLTETFRGQIEDLARRSGTLGSEVSSGLLQSQSLQLAQNLSTSLIQNSLQEAGINRRERSILENQLSANLLAPVNAQRSILAQIPAAAQSAFGSEAQLRRSQELQGQQNLANVFQQVGRRSQQKKKRKTKLLTTPNQPSPSLGIENTTLLGKPSNPTLLKKPVSKLFGQ